MGPKTSIISGGDVFSQASHPVHLHVPSGVLLPEACTLFPRDCRGLLFGFEIMRNHQMEKKQFAMGEFPSENTPDKLAERTRKNLSLTHWLP